MLALLKNSKRSLRLSQMHHQGGSVGLNGIPFLKTNQTLEESFPNTRICGLY